VPFSSSPQWHGEAVTEAQTDLGKVTLWWDTGAPLSALRSALVKTPAAQSEKKVLATKRFRLGDADFGPQRFELWDMELPGFDGFLGYDFFAAHVVCIDYTRHRVIIGATDAD
jgi:hypothetical protein